MKPLRAGYVLFFAGQEVSSRAGARVFPYSFRKLCLDLRLRCYWSFWWEGCVGRLLLFLVYGLTFLLAIRNGSTRVPPTIVFGRLSAARKLSGGDIQDVCESGEKFL